MNKYVFTIAAEIEDLSKAKLIVDVFYEMKNFPENLDDVSFVVAKRIDPRFFEEEADSINAIVTRNRFQGTTMHILDVANTIVREDLQFLLDEKTDEERKNFLTETIFRA